MISNLGKIEVKKDNRKTNFKCVVIFLILCSFLFNNKVIIISQRKIKIKDSYKILAISDIHNDKNKVKRLLDRVNSLKFDYIFFCGDAIDKIYNSNKIREYSIFMKNIFTKLEKIAPILWVPGNHEPNIYYVKNTIKITKNSQNLHKKIKKLDEKLYIVGLGGSIPILTGYRWRYNSLLFKELDIEKDFRYKGYPCKLNNYSKCDEIYINDLNEVVKQAKKEGGEDIQILYLTHIGPLYTPSNVIVENGEILKVVVLIFINLKIYIWSISVFINILN